MNRQHEYFKNMFLNASPPQRVMLIQEAVRLNDDPQITNLIANLDINYRMNTKDLAAEALIMRRADNIYFVTQQLAAFPNFKCPQR